MRSAAELNLISAQLAKAKAEHDARPCMDEYELLALKLVTDSINWCRGESNCIELERLKLEHPSYWKTDRELAST